MRTKRTDRAFVDEVPRLLRERELSIRALARQVGVTDAHLSRVLREVNYKTPSADLARRVSVVLGLPEDYFPETRLGYINDLLGKNGSLRDRVYDRLQRHSRAYS